MSGYLLYVPNDTQVHQYRKSRSNFQIQHESCSSTETKEQHLSVELQDMELWRTFDNFTIEVIVRKEGRWVTDA